mmetsp:Transcript_73299/g.203313  ORF Transcript_73299/g.203313 Transcript_73299/m.203313 type:complete len:229 (+) Transcript_73299:597-1283(+)
MFVAPTSNTLSSAAVSAPSMLVRNSFLTRREDSLSASRRLLSNESISSMKITEGCRSLANLNKTLTVFSASPIHFESTDEALMLKKVASHSAAIHFASNVFPVPGGPNSSNPRAGFVRVETNNSGCNLGRMSTSSICDFTNSRPAMSSREGPIPLASARAIVASKAGTSLSSCSGSAMRSHSSLHSRPLPPTVSPPLRLRAPPPPPPTTARLTASKSGACCGAAGCRL